MYAACCQLPVELCYCLMGNRIIVSLAIFSERENRYMSSSVRLSSATFVHRTQAIQIFGNVSMPFDTLASCDLSIKILRRSSQETLRWGGLNRRGVAKYDDFEHFQSYISETVQNRR